MGNIKITTTINRENYDFCKKIKWRFSDVIFWACEKRKTDGQNLDLTIENQQKAIDKLQKSLNYTIERLYELKKDFNLKELEKL